ncbi:PAS domain S-box protein [Phenylobacterium montanum]|uniref:histidine kinase n=1 Tax=Phenylobacterium montanum TaxID=2823693 RepID=A0A975G2B6_9CAUL|nr:PAS domain S-box protein [Caulobacter sp. S6]QUD89406.1 PAS domain S-box protein [Caulobacter sp. S6]
MTLNVDLASSKAPVAAPGSAGRTGLLARARRVAGGRLTPAVWARLLLPLVVAVAVVPFAGAALPGAWFVAMAVLTLAARPADETGGQGRGLPSWPLSTGYSLCALYLVMAHTGAAQTLGVTLFGVILFDVLVREYQNPRRLVIDLIPPAASIVLVQVAASYLRLSHHRPQEIVTVVASPFAVFLVFRSLHDHLVRSRRRLAEATDRAEANARRLEEAHRIATMAEALAGVGHWRLDVASRQFLWSEGVYRIVGLDQRQAAPGPDSLPRYWAEEDRALINDCLTRAMRDGTPFALEARLLREDGEVRHVVSNGAAERDAEGRIVTVYGAILDVTDAKRREIALGESEERFRLLADKSNDMIMQTTVSPDGHRRLTYVSPAVTKVLGYGQDEDPGGSTLAYVHPDDIERVIRSNLEQIAEGPSAEPRLNAYRARHKDGHWVWLEGKPTFTFDPSTGQVRGMVTVMRDVTAQKEAAEALARSEARYRLLAENATDVIIQVGADGVVLFVTPSCAALVGYEPDEMIGRPMADFVAPDDLDGLVGFIERLVATGPDAPPTVVEYRARHRDGRLIWIEGRPRINYSETGEYLSVQDVIRDITERKAAEARLAEAHQAAEAAALAKSDFLANMSHEIRTPLTAILGFSDMLNRTPALDDEARLYARRIANGGRTLLAVVNDILDFSKLEAGQVELDPQPFDPTEALNEAVELVAAQAEAKGLELVLDLSPDLPALVRADSSRLRQIVLNLLSNALKFTGAGRVTLVASYLANQRRLRVTVEDTGSGIPADKLDRLFERFSQVDGSINRRHGGTGLGLAICKSLVELMGGQISVHSTVGRGASFTFDILAPVASARPRPLVTAPAPEELAPGAAHILIVDDLVENRELVRLLLEAIGHAVTEAASGSEAVSASIAEPFDLILMDVQMPGMDGMTAARLIRDGGGANAATPILALSANVMADQVAQCLAAGMDDHIAKPLQVAELIDKVARWSRPAVARKPAERAAL